MSQRAAHLVTWKLHFLIALAIFLNDRGVQLSLARVAS